MLLQLYDNESSYYRKYVFPFVHAFCVPFGNILKTFSSNVKYSLGTYTIYYWKYTEIT